MGNTKAEFQHVYKEYLSRVVDRSGKFETPQFLAAFVESRAPPGGVPPGKRIFVQASTMVDGFESLPRKFRVRVPTA